MKTELNDQEKENLRILLEQYTSKEVEKGVKLYFKPSGIGTIIKARVAKHKKVDITDYKSW